MILIVLVIVAIQGAFALISLNGGITFNVAIIGSTQIQFTITASSSGWIGFGYGTCMWTNDLFVIEASGGSGTIKDMTMNYHAYPNMDTINDYTLSTVTSGSRNTYTVTRLLNDGDPSDYVITSGTTNIVYSWGSSTTMSYHGSNYGIFSISISGGSSSTLLSNNL